MTFDRKEWDGENSVDREALPVRCRRRGQVLLRVMSSFLHLVCISLNVTRWVRQWQHRNGWGILESSFIEDVKCGNITMCLGRQNSSEWLRHLQGQWEMRLWWSGGPACGGVCLSPFFSIWPTITEDLLFARSYASTGDRRVRKTVFLLSRSYRHGGMEWVKAVDRWKVQSHGSQVEGDWRQGVQTGRK